MSDNNIMEHILERFSGKIDTQSIVNMIEDIKVEYLYDGFTKEDIPPIIARIMMETNKFKNLPGPQKKKLVISLLNHLIEQIDKGEEDSDFEKVLKTMVPPMIDGFAGILKAKQSVATCFSCFTGDK